MAGTHCRALEPLSNGAPNFRNGVKEDPASDPRSTSTGGRERSGEKAGNRKLGQIGRPKLDKQVSNCHSGFGLSARPRFQFNIRAETEFGEEHHSLFQRWHALPCERRVKPVSRVMASDRGERQRAHPATSVGRAFQPVVVKQNRLAVGGEPDVELDPPAAERLCLAQSGKSVLGRICGGAAMADDRRQDSFDPRALRRNSG